MGEPKSPPRPTEFKISLRLFNPKPNQDYVRLPGQTGSTCPSCCPIDNFQNKVFIYTKGC